MVWFIFSVLVLQSGCTSRYRLRTQCIPVIGLSAGSAIHGGSRASAITGDLEEPFVGLENVSAEADSGGPVALICVPSALEGSAVSSAPRECKQTPPEGSAHTHGGRC